MEAESKAKKILVVEDNDDGRRLVSKVLKMHGYQVTGVATGEDAIVKAQSELPDLILMDIRLPGGIDGLEATKRIKSEPQTAHITILALTASVRPEDVQAALDAGCSGFARKPIDIDELPKQVEEYIKRNP
ncbi:MAG: response regulator [Dehalococcoidales bacterium]|nr:response regulator [Dehalococcoidales bacterium]